MSSYSGKFQYIEENGVASQSGACRATIEEPNLRLIPERGNSIAFDLGDIDAFLPGDYELALKLHTGKTLLLQQFGKIFQNLSHDLLEAYRHRLVQCLLLEDLEGIERFDGFAQLFSDEHSFSSRAEIRMYKSNIAVLPERATGLQWRLADIDSAVFDEEAYRIELTAGTERIALTKLAKRTSEFIDRLRVAMDDVSDKSARVIQSLFPFLTPDGFQQVTDIMREGRPASLAGLNSIDRRMGAVLIEKTVDAKLKPYFEILRNQFGQGDFFAGFKFIRPETDSGETTGADEMEKGFDAPQSASEEMEALPESSPDEEDPVLHWFLFPLKTGQDVNLPVSVVAWESTSRSGRATYFFRLLPPSLSGYSRDEGNASALIQAAVERISRGLVLLNFRREPIYLPDNSLETQPRYRRYAIACRKVPVLRQLRASFLGRALHTSPEAWLKQVEAILGEA
jgi:hypothetical protein